MELVPDESKLSCIESCRKLCDIVYQMRKELTIHITAISDKCCLLSMDRLKKLVIYGDSNFFNLDVLVRHFHNFQLPSWTFLQLQGFRGFEYSSTFLLLVDQIKRFNLKQFELSYGRVQIGHLSYILRELHTLQSCIVEVNMSDDETVEQFANLANCLCGKVNLNVGNLARVPSCMLKYARDSYRARFPTGVDRHW